jgi:hypothetical protein
MLALVRVDSDGVFGGPYRRGSHGIQGSDALHRQVVKVMREHIGLFKEQEPLFGVFVEDVTGGPVGVLGEELFLEKAGDGELIGVNPAQVFDFFFRHVQITAHGPFPFPVKVFIKL